MQKKNDELGINKKDASKVEARKITSSTCIMVPPKNGFLTCKASW